MLQMRVCGLAEVLLILLGCPGLVPGSGQAQACSMGLILGPTLRGSDYLGRVPLVLHHRSTKGQTNRARSLKTFAPIMFAHSPLENKQLADSIVSRAGTYAVFQEGGGVTIC